jgi:tetratricopeptide (TPR) repeat protein
LAAPRKRWRNNPDNVTLATTMSEVALLQETLRRAAARRRLESALRGLWLGLFAGSAAWLVALGCYKFLPLPEALATWAWILAPGGALLGFLLGGRKPVSLDTAARILEGRQALSQRLSTALEVSNSPSESQTTWTRLVVADAAAAIRGMDVHRLLPLSVPRFARWIPVLLAVVVGLGFVPEYRSAAHLQKQKDAAILRDTGKKMAELIRRELEQRTPAGEPVREALDAAGLLGDRLSQVKLTKADALLDLKNARERLEQEALQLDKDPALQRLQQAARTPGGGSSSANSALQKQLEKMQKSLQGATPDALDKLAEKLQQAQKAAAGMQGAAPDAAAQQAMAQALAQLAQTAQNLGLSLGGLEKALESLKNLQVDRLLQDLKQAGTDLEKMRDMAKKLAEMQQQMEQMGKDLAEQLDRGQADNAAETLDKMVEQLQQSGLTPEQIEKLMAEVSKALKPASQYGKVGEMLKKAAEQMKAGDKANAAKNLADAAKELKKLAQQAKDMDQLAEALDAMDAAQLAIMSGKAWQPGNCKGGACKGCGIHPGGKPGMGRGGKPGRGVGTWADENDWMYYPEISERWDNTGLDRPDMEGRGHTDRGEATLSKNVAPTKLQGQFTPGPMPSIPLRGVSITGNSSVQYQQAVDTAQSDAQSALNQDQIPRAYRGAVKGYFDDLK